MKLVYLMITISSFTMIQTSESKAGIVPNFSSEMDYSSHTEDEMVELIHWNRMHRPEAIARQFLDLISHRSVEELRYSFSQEEISNWVDPVNGETLVHLAVVYHRLDILRYLLRIGMDINGRNSKQETPLMIAAFEGSLPLVQFLIENGADFRKTNTKNQRATFYALESWSTDVVKYFMSLGVQLNPDEFEFIFEDLRRHNESPEAGLNYFNDLDFTLTLLDKKYFWHHLIRASIERRESDYEALLSNQIVGISFNFRNASQHLSKLRSTLLKRKGEGIHFFGEEEFNDILSYFPEGEDAQQP